MATVREPHRTAFTQGNGRFSPEVISTAQLLYLFELLEPDEFDYAAFCERVGHQPGELNQRAGCIQLLLEEGFELLEIDPTDPEQIVADIDYVRQMLRDQGYSEAAVAAFTEEDWQARLPRMLDTQRLSQKYAEQYTREQRAATPEDFFELLEQGYVVWALAKSEAGPGYAHGYLILERHGKDPRFVKVYSPTAPSLMAAPVGHFWPYLRAYRLPPNATK